MYYVKMNNIELIYEKTAIRCQDPFAQNKKLLIVFMLEHLCNQITLLKSLVKKYFMLNCFYIFSPYTFCSLILYIIKKHSIIT